MKVRDNSNRKRQTTKLISKISEKIKIEKKRSSNVNNPPKPLFQLKKREDNMFSGNIVISTNVGFILFTHRVTYITMMEVYLTSFIYLYRYFLNHTIPRPSLAAHIH